MDVKKNKTLFYLSGIVVLFSSILVYNPVPLYRSGMLQGEVDNTILKTLDASKRLFSL